MICVVRQMGLFSTGTRLLQRAASSSKAKARSSRALTWDLASEARTVVIVESEAKARTIQKHVDSKTHTVVFSAGNIRDLISKSGARALTETVICKEIDLKASNLGIDVNNGFKPVYVPIRDQAEVIDRLKMSSLQATRIILATDDDCNGEAMAWHFVQVLKPTVPFKRAVFHEITEDAILKAFANPRDIDMNLVHSQKTRRMLDHLTGSTVTPTLQSFLAPDMSSERVDLCGLHLIATRERKRWKFLPSSYCSVSALLDTTTATASRGKADPHMILARLQSVDSRRIATEKDFDSETGELRKVVRSASGKGTSASSSAKAAATADPNVLVLNETATAELSAWLSGASNSGTAPVFQVTDVDTRKTAHKPPPPFTTSSLQQEASYQCGFSPVRTMVLARSLYENGHITYVHTDSCTLSSKARKASRKMVTSTFGSEYLTSYASKGKAGSAAATHNNAQEAHEAIRPAEVNGKFALPSALALTSDEYTLYSLILRRTLASVMAPSMAVTNTYTITATATTTAKSAKSVSKQDPFREAVFKSSDTVTVFPGYLAAMTMFTAGVPKTESPASAADALLSVGQSLQLSTSRTWAEGSNGSGGGGVGAGEEVFEGDSAVDGVNGEAAAGKTDNTFTAGLRSARHGTRPPSRFTESSFINEMEELGVGRPSTYASIFRLLRDRGYVVVDKHTIIPTVRGMIVSAFLEKYFPQFVGAQFTAEMEQNLDLIARGEGNPQDVLHRFYLADPDSTSDNVNESGAQGAAAKACKGLVPTVSALFQEGAVDLEAARRLDMPFLAGLGEIRLFEDTVSFEEHTNTLLSEEVVTEQQGNTDTLSGINSSDTTETRSCSRLKWVLPDARADMQQMTPEGVRAIMQTAPYGDSRGLYYSTRNDWYGFESGRYGPYLKTARGGLPLPLWMVESMLDSQEAIWYSQLPLRLGQHPTQKGGVILDVKSGSLILQVQGFIERTELPVGTRISNMILLTALTALSNAAMAQKTSKGNLGFWNEVPVNVCCNRPADRFYVRCGTLVAPLDDKKRKYVPRLSLDDAIVLLEKSGKQLRSKRAGVVAERC